MDVCTGTGSVSHEEIVVDDSRRCPLCEALIEIESQKKSIEAQEGLIDTLRDENKELKNKETE